MLTFSTILITKQDPVKPAWTVTSPAGPYTFGPYSAPNPPASLTRVYVPEVVIEEKSPVNSNGSWKQIKDSGAIVMSPYFNRKTITRNFIAGIEKCDWYAQKHAYYQQNPPVCFHTSDTKLRTFWTQQGDLSFWSKDVGLPVISLNNVGSVADAVSTTQSSAMSSFLGGYDILTEIAEGRKAIQFFQESSLAARKAFITFFKGVDPALMRDVSRKGQVARDMVRSADKATRDLGKRWLAFRYAIMPLMYSYKDISDLFRNNGLLYKSFHSSQVLEYTAPALPSGLPGTFLFERYSGSVTVKSTVKAGYSATGLDSLVANQIQANVFGTAWELIPFSFVFDWFVNVGDFIVSHTSVDFSAQSKACTSVRTRLLREVFLVDQRENILLKNVVTPPNYPCYGSFEWKEVYKTSNIQPLVVENIDSYDRTLFNASDVSLSLHNSPFGDWRRIADTAALSQRSLKNLLRSVK